MAALAVVSACSPPEPPTPDAIRSQFSVDLPPYWRTSAFLLEPGPALTQPDQRYRTRFRAQVELLAPLYRERERIGDTVIVELASRAGERRNVYGRVDARLSKRAWISALKLENDPTRGVGVPREFIRAGRVIVAGSADERRFRQERERVMREAEAVAAQAARDMQMANEQAAREAYLQSIVGEWQGEAFTRRDSRLYITRSGETFSATFLHEGHREEMAVELLDDRRIILTGYAVVRQNGRAATNYNLDRLDVRLSPELGLLHGTGTDAAGQSGPLRLTRVGS